MAPPQPAKKTMSSGLSGMKFMQRGEMAQNKEAPSKAPATKAGDASEQWFIEYDATATGNKATLPKPRATITTNASYLAFVTPGETIRGADEEESARARRKREAGPVGRHSFRSFNPEVERVREEMRERERAAAPEEDTPMEEMARVMGDEGTKSKEKRDKKDKKERKKGREAKTVATPPIIFAEEGAAPQGARHRPASKRKEHPTRGGGDSSRKKATVDAKGFMRPS